MAEVARRALVTAWILALWWAGSKVPLPGLTSTGPSGSDLAVTTLGTVSLASGFLLVELVAFAVPAWRPMIRGGPADRARLWRAGVAAGVVMAAVQGLALALSAEQMTLGDAPLVPSPGPAFRAGVAGAVALCTVAFAIAARLVDRHGLGSGFAVLLAAGAATAIVPQHAGQGGAELLWALGPAAVAAGLVVRWSSPPSAAWGAGGVATIGRMASVASPGLAVGLGLPAMWLVAALVGAATRPARRVAGVGSPDRAAYDQRAAIARANRPRIVVRLGLVATLMAAPEWLGASSGLSVVVVALVAVDLVEEVRVRAGAPGPLVVAWSIHQPYLVAPALAALRSAGIPGAVRALRTRTWFGPWDPRIGVDVLVPEDRHDDAVRTLSLALAVGEPARPGSREPDGGGIPRAPGPPGDPWAAPIAPG